MEPVNIKAHAAALGAEAVPENPKGVVGFFEIFLPLIINFAKSMCGATTSLSARLKESQSADGSFSEGMIRRNRGRAHIAARHNDEDRHDNATGRSMSPKQWQAELDSRTALAYQRAIDQGEPAVAACAAEASEIPSPEPDM